MLPLAIRIYTYDGNAFVRTGEKTMLCIGTIAEVSNTTPEQVARMVIYAQAMYAFRNLAPTATVH